MKASTSGCSLPSGSQKRKFPESNKPSKKSCLWVDDIDDLSSCDSDDSDEDAVETKKLVSSTVKAVPDVNDDKREKDGSETSDVPVDSSATSEDSNEVPDDAKGTSIVIEESRSEEEKQKEVLKKEVQVA